MKNNLPARAAGPDRSPLSTKAEGKEMLLHVQRVTALSAGADVMRLCSCFLVHSSPCWCLFMEEYRLFYIRIYTIFQGIVLNDRYWITKAVQENFIK